MSAQPPPLPPSSLVDASVYTRQSRTYEPHDPDLENKRVRPFALNELEHIAGEYRDLHRALLRIMPESLFEPGFLRRIRKLLNQVTDMDIDLWFDSIRVIKRTHLRALMPGTTFLAVVGLAPLSEKILVEVDLHFVYAIVHRLLGGHRLAVDIHRPLTDIEQGVFSYLLLKVLQLFQGEVNNVEQVAVRLEDMRNDIKSTADILRNEDFFLCVNWKMNFDLDVGYVRALLPVGLARRIIPQSPPPGSALQRQIHNRIRTRMDRLAAVTVEAGVEIGRIELTRPDIEALEPGDIILPEETQVAFNGEGVEGNAVMRVGLGKRAALHGTVGLQGEQYVFQIGQIEVSVTPGEHDPQMVHGEHGNPEEVMAEYEDPHYEEADDGSTTPDDVLDEDYGIDDENEGEGDDEQYQDYEEGYGEYEDQGYEGEGEGYEGEAYEGEGYEGEEVPIDDNDNLAEAEPLLGDIPIAVVVELGRVQLTADEVIRLRSGQLIELGRSPTDPVDLVVNGKLLAKGELVEIEGALGVKLLNLVKEPEE